MVPPRRGPPAAGKHVAHKPRDRNRRATSAGMTGFLGWSTLAGGGAGGGGDGAVAAFAFLIVDEGFEEAGAIEIGPESFGDEDFGVGNLPEEEIADAHFAGGSDEEIGVGEIGGVEMAGEIFFGDGLRRMIHGWNLADRPI